MKQKKENRITLRLTREQYDSIAAKAETAQIPVGAYVRAAALRHKVTVVDGLPKITRELKAIGRNINQLTVLANMGQLHAVNLTETKDALGNIFDRLTILCGGSTLPASEPEAPVPIIIDHRRQMMKLFGIKESDNGDC